MAKAKKQKTATSKAKSADTTAEEAVLVEKKDLPVWNCRIEGTPADQQWTVGELFQMVCEGPTAKFLSSDIKFTGEKLTGYELRVLEVLEQTDNRLAMKATSYIAKPHDFKEMQISDQGEAVVSVEPFVLPMKSVITQQGQKPYGPLGPIQLGYPIYIWIVPIVAIFLALFFGLFRMNRRAQMRRVIEELKQHNTALGSFNQFNKDIRTLGRQYIFGENQGWTEQKKQRYLESLDEIFRMYLLREFYVPALEWNSSLVLKTISDQDKKRFTSYGKDLRKLLEEMDRAKDDAEKVQVHDCKQLTQMAKKVTQSIWRVRR